MLILWILLAVGAFVALYFAQTQVGDARRMLRVLGALLAIAAVIIFVIWLVGVLDSNTNVDSGLAVGGVALMRRGLRRARDELAATVYDVQALRSTRRRRSRVIVPPAHPRHRMGG